MRRILIRNGIASDSEFVVVDNEFVPILEHPSVQRLRYVSQFSPVVQLVFPHAMRSRFDHSLGTFWLMEKLTRVLLAKEQLTQFQAKHLKVASLIHDLPHGPYSHVFEEFLGVRHEEERWVYEKVREVVEEAGFDFDHVMDVLSEETPESRLLSHKILGVDALEYLFADLPFFGYKSSISHGAILPHVEFVEGRAAMDSRVVEEGKRLQEERATAYTGFYRRKACELGYRMVERLIENYVDEQGIEPREIVGWTDPELFTALLRSKRVGRVFRQLMMERKLPKQAIAIKLKGYEGVEVVRGKPMHVQGLSLDDLLRLEQKLSYPGKRRDLEEELMGLLDAEWVVITQPHYKARHISSGLPDEDISVLNGRLKSIFELYPEHHRALLEKYWSHLAYRIGVPAKLRSLYSRIGEGIVDLLLS